MYGTENLSLEQAPPISIPMRFFLTAPIFGIAGALLLVWYGPELFITRWSPLTLALTHLITLGFLGQIMCGALLQMLPVLAGVAVPRVVKTILRGVLTLPNYQSLSQKSEKFGQMYVSENWRVDRKKE